MPCGGGGLCAQAGRKRLLPAAVLEAVGPVEKRRTAGQTIVFNFYNELSSMTGQCLKDRKMTNIDMLREETSAWATNSNEKMKNKEE